MRICSSCFPKVNSVRKQQFSDGVSICSKEEETQSKFYCCGRVPPKRFYKKRHGMCDDKYDNDFVDLGIDAIDFVSSGGKTDIVNLVS